MVGFWRITTQPHPRRLFYPLLSGYVSLKNVWLRRLFSLQRRNILDLSFKIWCWERFLGTWNNIPPPLSPLNVKKMTGLSPPPLIFSGPARLDEENKIYFICFISLHLAEITGLKKLTFFELFLQHSQRWGFWLS